MPHARAAASFEPSANTCRPKIVFCKSTATKMASKRAIHTPGATMSQRCLGNVTASSLTQVGGTFTVCSPAAHLAAPRAIPSIPRVAMKGTTRREVMASPLTKPTRPPSVALLGGIVVGGLVGLVNGLAITSLRGGPFIATLGMLGIARGAAKWAAGEQTVNVPPTWVNELAVTFPKQRWLIVAPGVWIALLLAILVAVLLQNTIFGRHVFALGSNEAAARACGIYTARLKLWIYSLAGFFFGLAGVMQLSRLRQGDPTVAVGVELDVIAAVVIGGGSLTGGEGSILGSMVDRKSVV